MPDPDASIYGAVMHHRRERRPAALIDETAALGSDAYLPVGCDLFGQ